MSRVPAGKCARVCVTALALSFPGMTALGEASFTGIGDASMDLRINILDADPLSDDGRVVVGQGWFDGQRQAFRWTDASGVVPLGTLPVDPLPDGVTGGPVSEAKAVSADGSVIIGNSSFGAPSVFELPPAGTFGTYASSGFIWTEADGMLPLVGTKSASFVSADGSVALVTDENGLALWNADSGITPIDFAGSGFVRAFALAPDGSSAVGIRRDPNNPPFTLVFDSPGPRGTALEVNPSEAVIWEFPQTANGEPITPIARGLGSLPSDYPYAQALAISADGSTVVGSSNIGTTFGPSFSDTGFEPIIWTEAAGMVGLGHLNPDTPDPDRKGYAWDVSADGSVVVGAGITSLGAIGGGGFVWTEAMGLRSVYEILVSLGQADSVEGWTIGTVAGVSADGNVIVGTGTNPNGDEQLWIATIPEPGVMLPFLASIVCLFRSRRSTPSTLNCE